MPNAAQIKAKMLSDILTDLPASIRNKLTATIPAPPAVNMPTDQESALLVNGICSWYVLELFRPLAGLELVQIPLYLGQLNTVQHGGLLASLEYKTESQAAQDLTILEPKAARIYYPGDLRITASVSNGLKVKRMDCVIGEASKDMRLNEEGLWRAYLEVMDNGQYTVIVSAIMDDDGAVTASADFQIGETVPPENPEEEPELPGGDDEEAIKKLEIGITDSILRIYDKGVGPDLPDIESLYAIAFKIAYKRLTGAELDEATRLETEINGYFDFLHNAWAADDRPWTEIVITLGKLGISTRRLFSLLAAS